jgi:hypothetical protein
LNSDSKTICTLTQISLYLRKRRKPTAQKIHHHTSFIPTDYQSAVALSLYSFFLAAHCFLCRQTMVKRKHDIPAGQDTSVSQQQQQQQHRSLPQEKTAAKQQKRQKKIAGPHAEFKRILVRINVTLPPCYAGNPRSGVSEQLNRYLLRQVS